MKKLSVGHWVAVAVAVLVIGWFFAAGTMQSFFGGGSTSSAINSMDMTDSNTQAGAQGGLVIQDVVAGQGELAVAGKMVTAHYTGMLQDGTVFDSSVGRAPFTFMLGSGQVIQGWEKGIAGMREGGKRRLMIAPEMGYGNRAIPGPDGSILIPANSVLVFDVELLKVQ